MGKAIPTMVLVVCSWCGIDMSTKIANVPERLVTDGCVEFGSICDPCFDKEMEAMEG